MTLLGKYTSCLVVCESTGGYEKALKSALAQVEIDYKVINPIRVREFSKACGKRAKTDTIDAHMLAIFAEKMDFYQSFQPTEQESTLKDLVRRRAQLIEEVVREKNRRDKSLHKIVKRSIELHLKSLEKLLKEIEKEIHNHILADQNLRSKASLISSMPGIGPATASVILADLPELGHLTNKQIAFLVGVAPINKDSGQAQGYRKTGGGRIAIRCSLYMESIVAIRHNKLIKSFYQRLREQGKPAKVALTAAMRKMIIILNQMATHNQAWSEKLLPTEREA